MSQLVIDGKVQKGHIKLDNIPLPDNAEVMIYIIPKLKLENLDLEKVLEMTRTIHGNLSDDIVRDRGE